MALTRFLLFGCLVSCLSLTAQEKGEDVVFRSDVSLVRVDVQVLDRDNRSVQGLTVQDFVLREQGKIVPIRNFASDELPLDVLFLLDVSGSMRPHVEHIAAASRQALNVLGPEDRVALMVFDRVSRVSMPFIKERSQIFQGFDRLLNQERFNGGTDITRGLLDAVKYVSTNARKDVRRAIVILTDDQTQRERNEGMVLEALSNADTVLSALISPDAMGNMRQLPGGGWPGSGRQGGGGWPGAGGGMGWPGGGGVIIGGRRGGGYPGRYPGGGGYPGGGPVIVSTNETHSAGTPEIARDSGGDSVPVHDASSLENTLSRLRQRYSLYFQLPATAKAQQERTIQVTMAEKRNPQLASAELRYKSTYTSQADGVSGTMAETIEYSEPAAETPQASPTTVPQLKRRPAVEDGSGRSRGPSPSISGKPASAENTPSIEATDITKDTPSPKIQKRGWRRVNDPVQTSVPSPAPNNPQPD